MSKELKEYIQQIKEDLEKLEDKEILLHRLYYLTGQQIFKSAEAPPKSIIDLVKKSFATIQEGSNKQIIEPTSKTMKQEQESKSSLADEPSQSPAAEVASPHDKQEQESKSSLADEPSQSPAAEVASPHDKQEQESKSSLADEPSQSPAAEVASPHDKQVSPDTSVSSVRLTLSIRKKDFRYSMNSHDFIFASLPFQRFFLEAMTKQWKGEHKEKLSKLISSLAYGQLHFYFKEDSAHFSIGQKIEIGLLLFKKLGWGDFHFLVQQSPHLLAIENYFIEDSHFFAATLNGIFSYAYGFSNEQSFVVVQATAQELSQEYNHLKDNSQFFFVKDKL